MILCMVSTAILLASCGEAKQDINRNPPATPSAQQESTSSLNKADSGSALSETSSGSEETASGILSARGSSDESVPSDSTGSSVSDSSTIQVSESTISDVLGTEDSSGILLAFQEIYSNKDPEIQKSMTLSVTLFEE